MDDLLQEFIAETRETLEAISGEIVGWEADPGDRSRLDAIFRFVHTIKGSCGFLDLPRLARLSHAAEDALAAVRAGERAPDQALVTVILAIIDRIGEIVEAIDAGEALSETGEAMLIAAQLAPRFFPMLTTAAGTIRPSKVLVIGAGVAGLQAIATARRLGSQVEGFDVRPETREQIESLGGKFLDLGVSAAGEGGYARQLTDEERALQQQRLADHLRNVDVIVATAAVPGRPAPKIVSAQGSGVRRRRRPSSSRFGASTFVDTLIRFAPRARRTGFGARR